LRKGLAVESYGYYRVWIPDTIVSPWEAWLAAGTIMHHTNRLRIGLGVTNPYTRHPVVVAQMAATMQRLSGGRLTISIGKGIGRFLEKSGIDQNPSAVLIPFSLSRDDFFEKWNRVGSLDELRERVETLTKADFDEVIIAYRDMADLEMAAQLIKGKA